MLAKLELLMDIKEIRLINMQYLISSVKTIEVFADLVGTNASYISQVQSKKSKKNVGNVLARKIESSFNKEHGWMDKLHNDDAPTILNDKEALKVALANVMSQLISSQIYVPNKSLPHDVFASLVLNELEKITHPNGSGGPDLKVMETR